MKLKEKEFYLEYSRIYNLVIEGGNIPRSLKKRTQVFLSDVPSNIVHQGSLSIWTKGMDPGA